ncbi:hypothetical protein CHLRE_02g115550v5 [Chlamydomonas reinhardtii]|uniref:Uncharacterized protein n=1 Tax=Chlamydomonas reinhardtii TaxID=3055 RepID=A0A2K3E391_CHLRE|nr:uncharacterized protein CHLRE_02g115550v5 [Chlamydomonas reinhardtii]PNW87262.1 hypothetical protein CHLRE_02g115550v5 [Chlamydomonas reinhardtii]
MMSTAVTSLNIPARSRSLETMADAEEIFKVVRAAPADLHLPLFEQFWKLQAQVAAAGKEVTAMAKEVTAMAKEKAAKADEVTAMAKEKAAKADEVTAMAKELAKTREQLVAALYASGVVNARSFLEHVVSMWRMEQPGGSEKKRVEVIKDGLKERPDLVACLLRGVPSWTHANTKEEKKVESMAENLEAIFKYTSNDIHLFNPAKGLILRRDAHNGPILAALACVAQSMAVPCHIEDEKEDTSIETKDNNAPSA